MAPETDHGERLAVLETKIEAHDKTIKELTDKMWWFMVTAIGALGSVIWNIAPAVFKGITK